jgi:peptidoglycan/LPS O-acetylase OafA/YrhL
MQMRSVERNSAASTHLDMLRGIAALAVFSGHMRGLFFVNYASLEHPQILVRLAYFLTGFGHQAVMVFFVLSGYFISSGILVGRRQGQWNWRTYSITRLSRLYVVLVPALILTVVWDRLGMAMFGTNNAYYGTNPGILANGIANRSGPETFFGNLFFLQMIVCPSFGSNGPLWSLSYEFWYYVLFPLALAAVWRTDSLRSRLVSAILAVTILILLSPAIREYASIWLLGSAIAILPRGSGKAFWFTRYTAIPVFLVVVSLSRFGAGSFAHDFVIGLACAAVIYHITCTTGQSHARWYRNLASAVSAISYTLYLAHLPFLVFLSAMLIAGDKRWQPDFRHVMCSVGIVVVAMAYVAVLWWFAESRYLTIRNALLHQFAAHRTRQKARREARTGVEPE